MSVSEDPAGLAGQCSRPVLGLTSTPGESQYGAAIVPHQSVSVAFVLAVWAAGGAPVLVPTALPADSAAGFLDKLDGLILTGGGDVDPHWYGEAREERGQSPAAFHDVQVAAGTALAAAVGVDRMRVNALHHQAVRGLGQRLRPAAVAPDGIVEAVELEGPGWALGVQWHPELMLQADPIQLEIFRAVVGQARSRMDLTAADAAAPGIG
jgi:gamma-glutamyl-gamma-aminobutyrate hydrolase PuuD